MPYIVDSLKIRPVKVLYKTKLWDSFYCYTVKCMDESADLRDIMGIENLYGTEKSAIPKLIKVLDTEIEWCRLRMDDLRLQKDNYIKKLTEEIKNG